MGTRPERTKPRRKLRLLVEWLEGRELPTAPTLLAGPVSSVNLELDRGPRGLASRGNRPP